MMIKRLQNFNNKIKHKFYKKSSTLKIDNIKKKNYKLLFKLKLSFYNHHKNNL